jgi:hypothetical protein
MGSSRETTIGIMERDEIVWTRNANGRIQMAKKNT